MQVEEEDCSVGQSVALKDNSAESIVESAHRLRGKQQPGRLVSRFYTWQRVSVTSGESAEERATALRPLA